MRKWTYENPQFECDKINGDLLLYSPWSGHRNFIYDFIAYYRPNQVVELGSYYGCSAFAILQAIKDYKLSTKFYAIDTWEGDSFAVYGKEKVYETYKKVNDTFFEKQNSYMLRMTFDEASAKFESNSIDVLHIDGSHRYEDAKHDYLTWKDKMKKTGIILFHDISKDKLFGKNMGSHVFWEELKKKQSYTCEFDFSFGLGILFLSEDVYKDFLSKVNMQKYQRINNELAVNYKDVIRKNHFELIDKENWITSLQQDKEVLENDNQRLVQEIEKIKQTYEKRICEMTESYEKSSCEMKNAYEKDEDKKNQYIEELEDTIRLWKNEVDHIKHDYEDTIQGKDRYILELEQKLTSDNK